jgi:hypothetical protein
VVSGGMGVALLLHAQAIQQELDASISTTTDSDRRMLEDDKSRAKKGATVAFVISGVGIVTSIVWAVVAPSYAKPALAGTDMTLAVGPGSLGVAGKF